MMSQPPHPSSLTAPLTSPFLLLKIARKCKSKLMVTQAEGQEEKVQ